MWSSIKTHGSNVITVNFSCVEKLRLRFACCTCIGLWANTQFRGCCATAGIIEMYTQKLCTHAKRKRNFSTQLKFTVREIPFAAILGRFCGDG